MDLGGYLCLDGSGGGFVALLGVPLDPVAVSLLLSKGCIALDIQLMNGP